MTTNPIITGSLIVFRALFLCCTYIVGTARHLSHPITHASKNQKNMLFQSVKLQKKRKPSVMTSWLALPRQPSSTFVG